jgi:hypothetical protein
MTITPKKRPRDPLQLGKLIVDIATGAVEDREDDGKDPNAAALGRKGGAARAEKRHGDHQGSCQSLRGAVATG